MTYLSIAFDVDGVLADLVGHLCFKLRIRGLEVAPADVTHWDLGRAFGLAKKMAENELKADGFASGMPTHYSGVQALHELRSHPKVGQVLALTAPMVGSRTWLKDRREWLAYQGFDDHDILFVPGVHKHRVAVDVLVEDHAANLAAWCRANPNGQGFLIDRPWNQPGSDCYAEHERMVRIDIADLPKWIGGM